MSRAAGRKSNVPRTPVPGSPEGDEIGLSERQDPSGSPIPGLTGNTRNYETVRQAPATPDESFDEYRGMMAHGVPNASQVTEERALMERDGTLAKQHQPPSPPQHAAPKARPVPVPVYIVEEGAGASSYLSASPRHIQVPASTGDPVRICGRSAKRNRIGLLNEDTAHNIRFALRPGDLNLGGGALLPYPTNSYTWLDTQDELYALSADTGTPLLSIIEEDGQEL
jgi:hypothetical protein